MKIAMVGSGYVGLVSGACFADFGHDVVCIDKDPGKIERLNAGQMPIYEPGLEELVVRNMEAGRLSFTTELASAISGADAIFIAVGTPSRRGDGHADLTFVFEVAAEVGENLQNRAVIVTKSTVPVGTGDEVERVITNSATNVEFAVASNPEFLREGAAIQDFKRPDRIVIGANDEWARDVLREVYRPLFLNRSPILFTSRRSAELIKYAANAFLATKITFINEMADLCEKVGGDVQDIARGIGLDNRIGSKFLHAGPGYGGSCFPKDTLALLKTSEDFDSPLRVVEAVSKANDNRKRAMGRKVIDALGDVPRGKRVAMLGLTFKPNTDDMRDAPSIAIAQALSDAGVDVVAYDPEGMEVAKPIMPDVEMAENPYAAAQGADAVVIVTEWDAFRALDLDRIRQALKAPVLVDLRNVYQPEEMRSKGFAYSSIGRA
ncbi:MAG: UDP-glucose/GDP-mannose dehydrogenase family protein [Sphingomonadaceae bacterium]|nr:UDP-glucose/GDP-mannose dehydrogenase family protein [Sphingomonadaceae bacterium]